MVVALRSLREAGESGVPVSGLLIAGHVIEVPGVDIANPLDASWCNLSPRDYRARRSSWIRQIILHTTKGLKVQHIIPGVGPGGKDEDVAAYWRLEQRQSAAPIVVDTDRTAGCLCDVVKTNAYAATVSNDWSISIEMYQLSDGGVYESTLQSTVAIVLALCDVLQIPLQVPSRRYPNAPITRMIHGGPDMVGVFGHRDNTTERGWGDPGDEIGRRLLAAGAEAFDFESREDIEVWKRRQLYLNAIFGERLAVDGQAGPGTMAALRRHGFKSGRDIPA